MKAVNHMVGAPVESHVLLQCIVEAFPKPLNGWYRSEGWFFGEGRTSVSRNDRKQFSIPEELYQGEKYFVSESMINSYTWQMNLTVRSLHKGDFSPYICSSVNALGKGEARISLQGNIKEFYSF